MNSDVIRAALDRNGICFPQDLPEQLESYLRLLLDWNSRMDLTADTEEEEILNRHFLDSLAILRSDIIQPDAQLIDVGTGAGFPGMVLAMARPDLKITLMDAQQKRLNFLEEVRKEVGISNVELVHMRAEDGGRDPRYRERFDIAAARALAPMNILCEFLLPFVRTGGYALCWKGPALQEELKAGGKAAEILGGKLEKPVSCEIAGMDWDHRIQPILKIRKTSPVYPRKAGTPKSKPLGT